MRRIHPIAFVPGALFWACVAVGFATDNKVIVGVGVAIAVVFVTMKVTRMIRASAAMRAERKRVWRDGVPTTARIVNIGTKGGGINDNPMIDFELDVAQSDERPHRVRVSTIVSKLAIPRVQPGCEIAVRLDPRDPSNLVIDEALTPYGYR
jgi:hypothetical protein